MRRGFILGRLLVMGLVLDGGGGLCWAQIMERERDVKITGPKGRSIERSIVTGHGPGFVDRQVTIQRPGGTFHSGTHMVRPPAVAQHGTAIRSGGGTPGFRPAGGFGPSRGNVIINNGGGGGGPSSWIAPLAVGGGLFGLGMFAGSALSAPPPPRPVYAVPAPVYVTPAPPPTVIYNPPQPYVPVAPPQPPTVVIDPVADAVARLASNHDNSRRDGAYTLGRLRDPRAIPALVDRLKYDEDTDVRVAAATALGDIGDPSAAIFLERVTIYDKKDRVREAAAVALNRMPRMYAPQPQVQSGQPVTNVAPPWDNSAAGSPPAPAVSAPSYLPLESEPYDRDRVPPPPSPVTSGTGYRNNP